MRPPPSHLKGFLLHAVDAAHRPSRLYTAKEVRDKADWIRAAAEVNWGHGLWDAAKMLEKAWLKGLSA